jgi:hypothetical protein
MSNQVIKMIPSPIPCQQLNFNNMSTFPQMMLENDQSTQIL